MKNNSFLREKIIQQIMDMINKKKKILNTDKLHLDEKIDGNSVVITSVVKLYRDWDVTTIAWLSLKPKYLVQIKEDIKNNRFYAYTQSIGDANNPSQKMKVRLKPHLKAETEA
jgi:hypothetical protein